jgi:hypothetical protein
MKSGTTLLTILNIKNQPDMKKGLAWHKKKNEDLFEILM